MDGAVLKTLGDPVVAEMYRDILAQEGIVAMIPGAQHRGMLGWVGSYIEIPVKVPAEDAERAMEILGAIESELPAGDEDETEETGETEGAGETGETGETEGAEETGETGETESIEDTQDTQDTDQEALPAVAETERAALRPRESQRPEPSSSGRTGRDAAARREGPIRRKLKRVAFFIAFAIPGGGHFYVGAWRRGLLFLLAQLGGWIGFMAFPGMAGLMLVWIPCLLLADAIGAASRIAAANDEGPVRRLGVWVSRSLVVVSVVALVGLYLATEQAPEWFAGESGMLLCSRTRTCSPSNPDSILFT